MHEPFPEQGERVHAAYRDAFKHRWGGNVPAWRSLSPQERALWASVEASLRPTLAPRP